MKVFIICLCLAAYVSAVSVFSVPIMDAVLDSKQTATNFGSGTDATIWTDLNGVDPTRTMDLLFKLNVTGVASNFISAYVSYTQEYLDLGEQTFGPSTTFTVSETNNTWTESGVTWANAPYTLRTVTTYYQDGDINYVNIPVTTIVRDAISAGKSLVSIRATSPNDNYVFVWMRESSPQNRPKVIYNY